MALPQTVALYIDQISENILPNLKYASCKVESDLLAYSFYNLPRAGQRRGPRVTGFPRHIDAALFTEVRRRICRRQETASGAFHRWGNRGTLAIRLFSNSLRKRFGRTTAIAVKLTTLWDAKRRFSEITDCP
jgi:hypothetical protein